MALNATRKNRARKEARLFVEAKSAEVKSWFDNDVFDLVDVQTKELRDRRVGAASQKRSR